MVCDGCQFKYFVGYHKAACK